MSNRRSGGVAGIAVGAIIIGLIFILVPSILASSGAVNLGGAAQSILGVFGAPPLIIGAFMLIDKAVHQDLCRPGVRTHGQAGRC
ncbi:MAG: hypothetical protein U0075_08865 [Thermomicrobiales bacterium]